MSDRDALRYGREAGDGQLYGANAPARRDDEKFGRASYSTSDGTTYGTPVSDDTASAVSRPGVTNDGESWGAFEGDSAHRLVGGWPLAALRNKRGNYGELSGGPFAGIGQTVYRTSDRRIQEDVSERLTRHGFLDAHEMEVTVSDGEVTLYGFVPDHQMERLAEDLAASVHGVSRVVNKLRKHAPTDEGTTQEEPGPIR